MPNMSEQINELAAALVRAQPHIKSALKDAENPHLKSKFADLHSVAEACRLPLADQGLVIVSTGGVTEKGPVIITTLLHASGQWISGEIPLIQGEHRGINPMQGLGSCITYARRYGISAIANVVTEDDDGQSSSPPPQKRQANNYKTAPRQEQLPMDVQVDQSVLDEWNNELVASKSIDELQRVWSLMPPEGRRLLGMTKDAVKLKLQSAARMEAKM